MEFTEKKIILLVKEYASSLQIKTTPRIAGGWVRDKILGIKSDDIDFAIENISGMEFARGLVEFAGLDKNVHKIEANPEKSKHLETAIVNLFGYSIDFVILRTETYSNTRIPVIKPGTPEEDAFRRDMTINALFYNIISDEIEDFTKLGLVDIKNKILRTPLDCFTTFMDDPLRILRFFRFHAKLNFDIHKDVFSVLVDERIRESFCKKVSYERIWKEICKMLNYENGYLGLLEMSRRDFIEPVFKEECGTFEQHSVFCNRILPVLPEITDEKHKMLLLLFIVVHAYKEEEIPNVLKDNLKTPNWMVKNSKTVVKGTGIVKILFGKNKDEELLQICADFILQIGELWKITLIIFYGSGNKIEIEKVLEFCKKCDLEKKCLHTKFKVDGNDFKKHFSGIDCKKIPKHLHYCNVLEVMHPDMQKEETIQKALNYFMYETISQSVFCRSK